MQSRMLKSVAMVVLSCCSIPAMAASQGAAPQPIGRVTAAFGMARADNAAGARSLDTQSLINNDDRIITDGGGITVLLASRVVVKIDVHTAMSIFEGSEQTTITVEYGTVHVYVGQRPAQMGPVCIQDPNGNIETTTGVLLAHYEPSIHESYYACEHLSATAQPKNDDKPIAMTAD